MLCNIIRTKNRAIANAWCLALSMLLPILCTLKTNKTGSTLKQTGLPNPARFLDTHPYRHRDDVVIPTVIETYHVVCSCSGLCTIPAYPTWGRTMAYSTVQHRGSMQTKLRERTYLGSYTCTENTRTFTMSPKTRGHFAYAQTVCTRPSFRGLVVRLQTK